MITENCANEALKCALPFDKAVDLTVELAGRAITELNKYNASHPLDPDLPDSESTREAQPIHSEELASQLARLYLILLNRRGLIA